MTVIEIFVIGFIVVAVVGFLGNKISDGAENALRSRKMRKESENMQYGKTESLAARYKNLQDSNFRQSAADNTANPMQNTEKR